MRNKVRLVSVMAVFGLLAWAGPLFAHHSFHAEFDGNKSATLQGVITQIDWINPHAYWHIDVKGADGKVANWSIESLSPMEWRVGKVSRDMAGKAGDSVSVTVYLARDGTKNLAWGRKFTFADGHAISVEHTYDRPKDQEDLRSKK